MNVQIQGIKACLKSKQVRVKKQKINLSSQYFSLAKPTCTKKCLHSHHSGPNFNDFFFLIQIHVPAILPSTGIRHFMFYIFNT